MRSIIAFLFGVVITIGAAYIHDKAISPTEKPLVNWEQFNDVTHSAFEAARNQWNRLTK